MEQCELEKLHLSGQIQSFGAFLRIDQSTNLVTHVSKNISQFCDVPFEDVLGKSIRELPWFPLGALSDLPDVLGSRLLDIKNNRAGEPLYFRVIRADNAINVEIELQERSASTSRYSHQDAISYRSLQGDWTEQDYFNYLTTVINQYLPFNRVMLYRFEKSWIGEVVAEASKDNRTLYQGLKFPASDIPAIARRLYFLNPSRIIPSTNSEAVDIVSLEESVPDLTYSDLRSVSPVHIEYLSNMQVQASLSIPVIVSGELWGLIACHHPTSLKVDVTQRNETERLVTSFSSSLGAFIAGERLKWLRIAEADISRLSLALTEAYADDDARLDIVAESIKTMFRCKGVAVFQDERVEFCGLSSWREYLDLLKYAVDKHLLGNVTDITDIREYIAQPPANFPIRGALVIRQSFERSGITIMILRQPEVITNNWAGNPDKSLLKEGDNGLIKPRSSFKKWSETSGDESAPWSKLDVLMAKKIRAVILGLRHPTLR